MGLSEALKDETKRPQIIADAMKVVDEEVASKGGLGGFAVKKGYDAIKGVKPGFVRDALERLLPEMAEKIEPFWSAGGRSNIDKNKSQVADAMLSVTDAKIDRSPSAVVKSTYKMLRGSAKKNVEEALPRVIGLLEKYG